MQHLRTVVCRRRLRVSGGGEDWAGEGVLGQVGEAQSAFQGAVAFDNGRAAPGFVEVLPYLFHGR